jgi:hypothetical protein
VACRRQAQLEQQLVEQQLAAEFLVNSLAAHRRSAQPVVTKLATKQRSARQPLPVEFSPHIP